MVFLRQGRSGSQRIEIYDNRVKREKRRMQCIITCYLLFVIIMYIATEQTCSFGDQ